MQRYNSNSCIALQRTKRNDTLKKKFEEMINDWVATQKVLPMETDFEKLSEREVSEYVDQFYNDLTEDFNFNQGDQLVMLDSELEEEWTKVTTQLDAAFYKYTQAEKKSGEQYPRIRSYLGGKYGIEGLLTMNTQTIMNRIATLTYNIDKKGCTNKTTDSTSKGSSSQYLVDDDLPCRTEMGKRQGFINLKPNKKCESRLFENTMKDPTSSSTITLLGHRRNNPGI
ncbi:hypothetical protein TKK_0012987 [Trichogramma kaykai]